MTYMDSYKSSKLYFKKYIRRGASAFIAGVFLVNTLFFDLAIAQPSVSTLAPLAASENPKVKREITASMYRASRLIWLANSPRYLDLLARYNALALLLPSGRYLMTPETAANDLLLIRSAIHEDNEILMQQEEKLHSTRYNRLMRQMLGRDDIMKLYRALSHYKDPNKQPDNIIFNDLIAKAFEILSIIDENLVYLNELKPEEREFIALMRPILQAKDSRNRYKNFSQVFFDTDKRTKAIKALQENKDERFYRVANEDGELIESDDVARDSPRPIATISNQTEINKYANSIVGEPSGDVVVLTLQTDDRAIKDLSEGIESRFNRYEGGALLGLLHRPSKSREEIEARQKMIDAIRNLANSDRKALSESKGAVYALLMGITKLLDNDTREGLLLFADKSKYNAEKLKKLLAEEKKAGKNDSVADIRACVASIEEYKDSITHFSRELEKINDPLAKAILAIFKDKSANFKVPTLQDILTALQEKRLDTLSEISSNALVVFSVATNIGMVVEFAELTKDEEYGEATFDDSKPIAYSDGWNFMRRKEGQVKNPSGKDTTIKLLTGSNMSGKSFFLVQNLFMQLVGQSFGFIPAASGNLRIYDQIVFIDRASTNAMMNLSAFGSEVNKWKTPLEAIGKKALYLVDEGFSTTSPDDQAKLLTGASNYFRNSNAHVIFATHNEKFIMAQQHEDVSTYHFETIINEEALRQHDEDRDRYSYDKKEPVTFTHKLKDGFDDSKALEVAAQLGLQGRLIARAREFLSGKAAPVETVGIKKIPKVTAYSEQERARLKKKRGSFLPFFPYEDVLIERENAPSINGEPAPLEWKYDMGNPHQRRYYGDDERRPKFKFDPIFALFSGDHDFSPWSIDYVDYGVLKNQEILQGIHKLVMLGPSRDPKEILERQRMFRAIMSDKNTSIVGEDWKVSTMLQRLGTYLEGFTLGAESSLDRFNLYLLLKSLEESTEHMATEERCELFIKILEMNLILNGSSLEKAGVADDVAKVTAIWKLRKELRAFSDRIMSKKSESDKDRQELKTRYEDLRARVKQVTGEDDLSCISHVEYGTEELVKPILIRIFGKATGIKIHKDVPIGFLIEDLKEKKSIGNLKAVSALEPENWDMIDKMLEGLMPTIEKEIRSGMGLFVAEHIRFCQQLRSLLYKGDALTECTEWLKSYDSVHLHQIANYFEFTLRPMIGNIKNGREYLAELKKVESDTKKAEKDKVLWDRLVESRDYAAMLTMSAHFLEENHVFYTDLLSEERPDHAAIKRIIGHIEVLRKAAKDGINAVDEAQLKAAIDNYLVGQFGGHLGYSAKHFSPQPRRRLDEQQVWAEFSKLVRIFALAFVIKDNGWHEVAFTDKPELGVTNAWSIVKTKKDQVRNSAHFDLAEMARLYSGSNMSGKTFHLKQLIWAILAAQATGFAPCDEMTSPVFEKVLYIDRVKAESDRNISAFGLEAKYWKDFFEYASRTGLVFGGVDEAGSTTSPKYQSAISYAIAEEMLGLGNMLAMASHNHDFLDAFHDANKGHVGIYHFKTHEGEDGSIAFDYRLEDGHEPSNAIKVAEKLGLGMVTSLISETESPPTGNPATLLQYMFGYRDGMPGQAEPIGKTNSVMPKDMAKQRGGNDSLSNIYRELAPLERAGLIEGNKGNPRYLPDWVLKLNPEEIIRQNPELSRPNLHEDAAAMERVSTRTRALATGTPSSSQRLIPMNTPEIPPMEQIGEKAYKLIKMAQAGLNVPPFFIIATDGSGQITVTDELRKMFAGIQKPAIVRSTHRDEGTVHPFSGVFDSFGGITAIEPTDTEIVDSTSDEFWDKGPRPESLISAYRLILESATEGYRIKKYLEDHKITNFDPKQMNAVVMEEVDIDVFGMFMTSSQNNPDEVLIHYQVRDKGTAEKAEPESGSFGQRKEKGGVITYNRKTRQLDQNNLDEQTRDVLRQFGDIAGQIEGMFGVQQIELAASKGKVYVLQSRNINLSNPHDVPRLAHYNTMDEDLQAIGYGYYHLPILVIDTLENAHPEYKEAAEYKALHEAYAASGKQWEGTEWDALIKYTDDKKNEYREELRRFQREHPEYVLVIKDASAVIDSEIFAGKNYGFLNELASKAKVVVRGRNQNAIRHEDWQNVELGALTIIPPEVSGWGGFINYFICNRKDDDHGPGEIFTSPSKKRDNVSVQHVRKLQTGDTINVLSNIDGVFVWLGSPLTGGSRAPITPSSTTPPNVDTVKQSFSVLDSEAKKESQLSASVSKLRGTSQNLMEVNKFKFCLPIEVLRNSPDIALALNSTGLLKQKPQDAENIEFELVVTGVTEEDVKIIEGLNRDDIKKALNLPKKFTVSIITEAQIQETAQRFGYDASNPKNRVAIVKDFFSGALAKGEYMAIATDALDTTEKADLLKEELEKELKDELSQENISIRVLVRPESGKSMYSLSKIINDWLEAINQGNFSTISRILPIPAPLTPELERAIRTAWAVLTAA